MGERRRANDEFALGGAYLVIWPEMLGGAGVEHGLGVACLSTG